jgi:hypothetical protein
LEIGSQCPNKINSRISRQKKRFYTAGPNLSALKKKAPLPWQCHSGSSSIVSRISSAEEVIQAAAGGSSTRTSSVLESRYPQRRLGSRQIVVGGSVEINITRRHVVPHDGGLERPQTGAGVLVFVELLATRNDVKFFVRERAEVTSDVCIHVHLLFAK